MHLGGLVERIAPHDHDVCPRAGLFRERRPVGGRLRLLLAAVIGRHRRLGLLEGLPRPLHVALRVAQRVLRQRGPHRGVQGDVDRLRRCPLPRLREGSGLVLARALGRLFFAGALALLELLRRRCH